MAQKQKQGGLPKQGVQKQGCRSRDAEAGGFKSQGWLQKRGLCPSLNKCKNSEATRHFHMLSVTKMDLVKNLAHSSIANLEMFISNVNFVIRAALIINGPGHPTSNEMQQSNKFNPTTPSLYAQIFWQPIAQGALKVDCSLLSPRTPHNSVSIATKRSSHIKRCSSENIDTRPSPKSDESEGSRSVDAAPTTPTSTLQRPINAFKSKMIALPMAFISHLIAQRVHVGRLGFPTSESFEGPFPPPPLPSILRKQTFTPHTSGLRPQDAPQIHTVDRQTEVL
ncbi:hypothetical protein BDZ97DRAFT_1757703 [Flammula alnicola]|nr:hypothetical protein BDZ97DRAFT_1757703 [Flammula alnicola]